MSRSLCTTAALGALLVFVSSSSCSDSDSTEQSAGGQGGGASGAAGKSSSAGLGGSAGSSSKGGGGKGGNGGSTSSGGETDTGGSNGQAGQGGIENGGSGNGGNGGDTTGSGGMGGAPYIPDVPCIEHTDCDGPCQAYGWPEGRCFGSDSNYCLCINDGGSPTCEVKSIEGCPTGMHCTRPGMCVPIGPAAPGGPCPNGDECPLGHICIGYGNPLPNGESTACREICDPQDPPPNCDCQGGGFCANSGEGGSGGAGGSGGSDGGCNDVLSAPCADANPDNIDFTSGAFGGCAHWNDPGPGSGWVIYGSSANTGFSYDVETGLAWVQRTATQMSQADVATFCDTLVVQGFDGWRIPTINEVRTLLAGCPDTAPGGSCTLGDPDCLATSCNNGTDCTGCAADGGPHGLGKDYCRPEINMCLGPHTSSLCEDCATASDWRYNAGNGNFYAADVTQLMFPVCVMGNVPEAMPCIDPGP